MFEKSHKEFSTFSPQWLLRHQKRWLCEDARIFEPRGFFDERFNNGTLFKLHTRPFRLNRFLEVFYYMVSLFYSWVVIYSNCNLLFTCTLLCMSLSQLTRAHYIAKNRIIGARALKTLRRRHVDI